MIALNSRKRGVALGETAAMIVVIGALSVISYVQIKKVLKMSDVRSAVAEYNNYKQAIIGFQGAYGYLPGDLPINKLGGALAATLENANFANGRDYEGEELGDGRIGPKYGVRLSFQQLAVGGFIESDLVNNKMNLSDKSKYDLRHSAGYSLPLAKFNKKAVWFLTTEDSINNYKFAPSVLHDSSLLNWKGRVKLYLANHTGVGNRHDPSYADGESSATAPLLGAMSPDFAYSVDIKMDDGSPTKSTGSMVADDSLGYKEGCRSQVDDISDSIYKEETSGKVQTQCVVAFSID